MRQISIQDDLRLRFPHRDAAFADGVEIGMLATLMAFDLGEFSRTIAAGNLEQLHALASRLGYQITSCASDKDGEVRINARRRGRRPMLRVVGGSSA